MKSIYIKNITVHTETDTIEDGALLFADGKIKGIFASEEEPQRLSEDVRYIDGAGLHAIPGFIDGHIHGAAGADVMDATEAALNKIARALPAEGTTSFLATTITQAPENLAQALINAGKYETKPGHAEMIGVHLEGPFINKSKAGAQPREYIICPDSSQFEKWQQLADGKIKTVTMSPELDEQGTFIKQLADSGVNVSAGHTDIGFSGMKKAVASGVRQVTHLCNAMSGIHHRDIGAVGAAFRLKELRAELIADGIHVSEDMLALIFHHMGSERLMLITDAMRAKCLAAGEYELGGQPVTVTADRALLHDGTLAGSILKMCEGARNMLKLDDVVIQDIINMTAVNPAKQLGIFDRKASITVGKDADVLLTDDALNLKYTICRGVIAYQE